MTIRTVKTPDAYVWKCPERFCRFTISTGDKGATAAQKKRHEAKHLIAEKGTRVRLVGNTLSMGVGRHGDTGRITFAYIDQDRFGVVLDRKGKCSGCQHCYGCGGPTSISVQVKFDQLERLP